MNDATSSLTRAGMLNIDNIKLVTDPTQTDSFAPEQSPREALLISHLSKWKPLPLSTHWGLEAEFARYLQKVLDNETGLQGAQLHRDLPFAGVDVPFEIDFLLSWADDRTAIERIGIEFVWLRSPSTFFGSS